MSKSNSSKTDRITANNIIYSHLSKHKKTPYYCPNLPANCFNFSSRQCPNRRAFFFLFAKKKNWNSEQLWHFLKQLKLQIIEKIILKWFVVSVFSIISISITAPIVIILIQKSGSKFTQSSSSNQFFPCFVSFFDRVLYTIQL